MGPKKCVLGENQARVLKSRLCVSWEDTSSWGDCLVLRFGDDNSNSSQAAAIMPSYLTKHSLIPLELSNPDLSSVNFPKAPTGKPPLFSGSKLHR